MTIPRVYFSKTGGAVYVEFPGDEGALCIANTGWEGRVRAVPDHAVLIDPDPDALAEARREGYSVGYEDGVDSCNGANDAAYEEGYSEGYGEGYDEGYADGLSAAND